VELELLDEHAASSTAAPAASTPKAIRTVLGFRLPFLKRFIRPRIYVMSHRGLMSSAHTGV